jgi:hypothetical protein
MRILLMLASSLSLLAGVAVAQTAEPHMDQTDMGQAHMQSRIPGAAFSLDRGAGRGSIGIHCAGRDTTRECVEAVLPLLGVLSPDGAPGTGVAYATTSIKCGDTVYEVSTGTTGGACGVSGPTDGQNNNTSCVDEGNKASATCKNGCGPSAGAGSCTIKTAQ